jgi:hypothetical protein
MACNYMLSCVITCESPLLMETHIVCPSLKVCCLCRLIPFNPLPGIIHQDSHLSKQACFDIFFICPLTLDLPDVILTILFCAYYIVANSATTTTTLPRQLSRQRNVSALPAAALFLLSFLSGIRVALLYSEVVTLFHRSCHL